MDFRKQMSPASVAYQGKTWFIMPAEAHLRFQNTDGEGNFLDEVVPIGKQWRVMVTVNVVETDAA